MSKKNRARQKRARENKPEPRITTSQTIPRNWIIGLILGVTFLTFSNTLFNGFAYDDQTFILKNDLLHSLSNIPTVLTSELWFYRALQDKDPNKDAGPTTPYYRPTFSIFHMVLWQLFRDSPGGWHLTNILIHLLAVYLAFLILERITKDLKVSAIASLLFAIHPLRSESVAWICGISDPFLTVFLLLSLHFYLRYRDEQRSKLLFGSLGLYLLAVFAKEPAVAFPIFIGAYELFGRDRDAPISARLKSAMKYAACFAAVVAFYFAARYYALGFILNNSAFKSYPAIQILLTIPLVIWKYIGLLVWPVDLSLFHATSLVRNPLEFSFILPTLGLIALGAALWPLRKSNVARFALSWFFVNLLPVLNLSAFGEDFLVQERYIYIPSIGFSLLVAMALARLPVERLLPVGNRLRAQSALVVALALLFSGKSLAQNAVWRDDISVWNHGVAIAPEQPMSHFILGHKLLNRGDYKGAIEEFEKYMKIIPDNPIVLGNLASALVLTYQNDLATGVLVPDRAPLDRALELSEKGLAIDPTSATLWDAMGNVHTFETGLKNYDRAIACFERGLLVAPENPMIKFHLGGTLIKKGKLDDGIALLQEAVAKSPEIVDAHKFLAYAYRARGQFKPAIDELTLYLKLKPDAPDASKVSKDVDDLRARLQPISPQS
jgi:tetratricopeptide (TPR) repeat protein